MELAELMRLAELTEFAELMGLTELTELMEATELTELAEHYVPLQLRGSLHKEEQNIQPYRFCRFLSAGRGQALAGKGGRLKMGKE